MKVLLINGSPHKDGCTYHALAEAGKRINEHGIETEFFHIGTRPVHGCLGCQKCMELKKCVFDDDPANELLEKLLECAGVIVGSPVYYAGPNGALCALLDRAFFAAALSGRGSLAHKPAAAVVNCRRGGASAAFDRLNKYFTISRMHVVSSQYWNSTHGFTPEEQAQDLEGLQTMRTLGDNMAWLIKAIKESGLPAPDPEPVTVTNFI